MASKPVGGALERVTEATEGIEPEENAQTKQHGTGIKCLKVYHRQDTRLALCDYKAKREDREWKVRGRGILKVMPHNQAASRCRRPCGRAVEAQAGRRLCGDPALGARSQSDLWDILGLSSLNFMIPRIEIGQLCLFENPSTLMKTFWFNYRKYEI